MSESDAMNYLHAKYVWWPQIISMDQPESDAI
jgi:hypothetical protein